MPRKLRFLPLLLALPACTDSYEPEPDPGYGELGVGVFLYECRTLSDPACVSGGSVATTFPRAFAVGGRFSLQYDWRDSDDEHLGDPLPQIQSAAPQLLARAGDGLEAVVPGYAAVLAVTGDSEVVDVRHLYLAEVAALQVVPLAEPLAAPLLELSVEPGETLDLLIRPVDGDDVSLSGQLAYTWSSSDIAVVQILSTGAGDTGQLRISAGMHGESTLRVMLGELTTDITIRVGATETTLTGDTDTGDIGSTGDTGDTGSTGDTGDTGSTDDTGSSDSSGDSTGSTGSTGGVL